jgi:hypothetical protein
MLGKGRVQKQAFAELIALPLDHPYREMTLRHIATLQETLRARQNKDQYLEDMVMTLVSAYDRMVIKQRQLGKEDAHREVVLTMASQGFQPEAIAVLVQLSPDQVSMIYDQIALEQRQRVQEEMQRAIALKMEAIALNMSNQGLQPEAIATFMGLPLDQVQALLQTQPRSES